MTKKRRGGTRPTKRMRVAKAALVEAATELACIIGTSSVVEIRGLLAAHAPVGWSQTAVTDLAVTLAGVYSANDEWQEAQMRGAKD